jgi:nicotinamide-nucleotide amidase
VVFHLPALDANVFLELAFRRVEGVAQGDIDVFMGLLVMVFAADDEVLVGHTQVDADVIEITLVLVVMLGFHCDSATDDVITELLQLGGFFANLRFHGLGMGDSAKRNLQWYLHSQSCWLSLSLVSREASAGSGWGESGVPVPGLSIPCRLLMTRSHHSGCDAHDHASITNYDIAVHQLSNYDSHAGAAPGPGDRAPDPISGRSAEVICNDRKTAMEHEEQLYRLAEKVGKALAQGRLRLVTAESCTGGWVAQSVTSVPGSSLWFDRGFVTYSNESKEELLGVPSDWIAVHGAVSEAVVLAMAEGALERSWAHCAVAVSGVAGPEGGTPEKPVGTVWVAWQVKGRAGRARHFHFSGNRAEVRRQAVEAALAGILEIPLADGE